ncbi:hypothetical protein ACHAXA_011307 [Cyclostephanos tholiformis]|uniref:Uncharacterized protein n=1 Tax=Cyclostephanos tholiformis TaxID=382380 RepID=A0ABD3RWD7_9STRA
MNLCWNITQIPNSRSENMINRIKYLAHFAIAFLLAGEGLVKADVYTCGVDYGDAAPSVPTISSTPTSLEPSAAVATLTVSPTSSTSSSPISGSAATTTTTSPTVAASTGLTASESKTLSLVTMAPSVPTLSSTPTSLAHNAALTTSVLSTTPPTPALLYVCAIDYDDASENYCGLKPCPLGDGCAKDLTCYAIPYAVCTPTTSPVPTKLATIPPTEAPVYNVFFCGETYEMAEANCWTAEACPSGTCSKTEEQCYGISTERCLSPAPTDAPTVAEPTTTDSMVSSLPTPASASPTTSSVPTVEVVNTQFCGLDYDDAMSSCSEATACPSGSGCPSNMGCYTGISCTATLTLLTTNAPATGSHVSSLSTPASTSPTTSSASTVVNTQFCGMDYDDAMASCSEATACPTGDGCLNVLLPRS